MYVCKTKALVHIKLVLSITLAVALPSINNFNITIASNSTVSSSVDIPIEGGGKLSPPATNVTIIPGPNLDKIVELKQRSDASNHLTTNDKAISLSTNSTIPVEGGGKFNDQLPVGISLTNHTNTTQVQQTSLIQSQVQPSNLPSNITDVHKSTTVAIEGVGKPQPINEKPPAIIPKQSHPSDEVTPERTIPVYEVEGGRQKITPRKGVNSKEYSEFKELEKTTIRPLIKKPLITEASEDEPLDDHPELTSRTNSTKPAASQPHVPTLDNFDEFSKNTQQYVIPIVIVILSVPLVTIVISYLLKRGTEWWKYRHYRRMDFLINGIYDT